MKPVCRNIIISILFVTFFTAVTVNAQKKDPSPVPADKISADTPDREPGMVERATKKEETADLDRNPELRKPAKRDGAAGLKEPVVKRDDSKAVPGPENEKVVPPAIKKVQAVRDSAKAVKPEKKDEPRKVEDVHARDSINGGLLTVSDMDIRYQRIPEYSAGKLQPDKKSFVNIPAEKETVDDSAADQGEEGLFGLSKGKTDLIARGSLILLILVIFILYRTRSKSSDRKVLRRFPKK